MIEIEQVAEASLESDRSDHVAGRTRIDQTTMRARAGRWCLAVFSNAMVSLLPSIFTTLP
jgi:hypothetical protein